MKTKLVKKLMATGDSFALFPLRLVVGLVMAGHGAQKLFGWFGGHGLQATGNFFQESLGLAPGVFWAFNAGAAEFFGGLLLISGFLTRVGAGLNAITMAVAILLVHRSAFFLSNNGMEFALTLFAACLTLFIAGGGKLSVDHRLARRG